MCFFQRQKRSLASNKDRRDHARENDHIPQWQHSRFDQAIGFGLHVRDAVQLLRPLRKRQIKFVFIPIRLTHLNTSVIASRDLVLRGEAIS